MRNKEAHYIYKFKQDNEICTMCGTFLSSPSNFSPWKSGNEFLNAVNSPSAIAIAVRSIVWNRQNVVRWGHTVPVDCQAGNTSSTSRISREIKIATFLFPREITCLPPRLRTATGIPTNLCEKHEETCVT